MTSSTSSGGTLARSRAAFRAIAPSSGAERSASPPRNLPIGVRAAASRKASGMGHLASVEASARRVLGNRGDGPIISYGTRPVHGQEASEDDAAIAAAPDGRTNQG